MGFNEKARKIWKDPVLSKVISAIIIALSGLLYAFISKFEIKNPLSWGIGALVVVLLFIIFRYILKMIIFHEDSISIIKPKKEPLQEINTKKDEDIEEKIDHKARKSEYNWLDSDILFSQCIAHTFPGDREVVWYNSSEAVHRLNLFLKIFIEKNLMAMLFGGEEGMRPFL